MSIEDRSLSSTSEGENKNKNKKTIFDILNQPELDDVFYLEYGYSKSEIQAYQHYQRGKIIESIQQYVQKVILENRNIGESEIVETIYQMLVSLPVVGRNYFIGKISEIVNKFNTVRNFLNFDNGFYKNPKELLCAIVGITNPSIMEKISRYITVRQYGLGFMFFIGDKKTYETIYKFIFNELGCNSVGFSVPESKIAGLDKTLSVVNFKDTGENMKNFDYLTVLHESQHNFNSYFMIDFDDIGDEIIAYLKEGTKFDKILEILTKSENKGGVYQNGFKGKEWGNYRKQVRESLGYAKDLIELTNYSIIGLNKNNVISMLVDTPRNKRKELHTCILNAINFTLLNKLGRRGKSIEEIKNILNEITQTSNNTQRKYGKTTFKNNSDSFIERVRWTGTAEKQSVINEIYNANSIDEIKHILNDPKYSHISREPNNKGGIEISEIIDEFINGNEGMITFIPSEIREKVQELSNKG